MPPTTFDPSLFDTGLEPVEPPSGGTSLDREFIPRCGSAIDPLVDRIAWHSWRLESARSPHDTSGESLRAAQSLFQLLAEMVGEPHRTIFIIQALVDAAAEPAVDISFTVGLIGDASVAADASTVARIVESRLRDATLPYSARRVDPKRVVDGGGRWTASANLRQRVVRVGDDAVGCVEVVLSGSIPLSTHGGPRSDYSPTNPTLFAFEQQCSRPNSPSMTESSSQTRCTQPLGSTRSRPDGSSSVLPAERAIATLSDLNASLGSPVLCGELALLGIGVVPRPIPRAVAACFTSEAEVLRRGGPPVVAGQNVILGGFDLEFDPPGLLEAVTVGVPLRGGLGEHELRDVWTLSEAPLAWPLPLGNPIPGVPTCSEMRLPVDSARAADPSQ